MSRPPTFIYKALTAINKSRKLQNRMANCLSTLKTSNIDLQAVTSFQLDINFRKVLTLYYRANTGKWAYQKISGVIMKSYSVVTNTSFKFQITCNTCSIS